MKTILLIGGGGHCKAVIDVIEAQGDYRIRGTVQPKSADVDSLLNYPIVGEDADLPKLLVETSNALVTVGQIKTATIRKRIFDMLKKLKATLPLIVSPLSYVSSHAHLGDGTVVMHGSIINAAAKVGINAIINSQALIEHDVVVGDHCHISTGANINGGSIIENGCFIGSGVILKQGVRIGKGSVIGAGCVVTQDIAPNSVLKPQKCTS